LCCKEVRGVLTLLDAQWPIEPDPVHIWWRDADFIAEKIVFSGSGFPFIPIATWFSYAMDKEILYHATGCP